MRRVGAVLLILGSAVPASAEDLPRVNVQLYCSTEAGALSGGAKGCRKAEEAAREIIQSKWNSYPKQRKHFCVQAVTFLKKEKQSYTALADCLGEPLKIS